MKFELTVGPCPECTKEKLDIQATRKSDKEGVVCPRGHTWKNLDDYYQNISPTKRKQMEKSERGFKDIVSGIFSPGSGKTEGSAPPPTDAPPAVNTPDPNSLLVDEIDKARLTSLLGEFSTASDLVGLIFSLNEEKKALEDKITSATKIKAGEEDGKVLASGDIKFEAIIPERHVQPLIDLSHSWNSSVTRYMNERLCTLLDDMLFY
jgi:hypothetical protein